MNDERERRLSDRTYSNELKRQLNESQLATMHMLERFGWELKFIRRIPGQPPVMVLHDPDTKKFAILKPDGELEENLVQHQFRL